MTTPDRTDGDGLKACPICNGPGEASTAFDGSPYQGHVVICASGKCGCQSGVFPTPAMARKAWNTRAAPQAPDTGEGTGIPNTDRARQFPLYELMPDFTLYDRDPQADERLKLYRDIFAEITAKAIPVCDQGSNDPERVRHYIVPVGPLHRAAGKLGFQLFNGERHLADAVKEIARLNAAPPKPAPDHADDFGDMPSAYLAARSSLAKPAPDALQRVLCGIVGTPDANGMVTFKVHESVVRQMQPAGEPAPDALREAMVDEEKVILDFFENAENADLADETWSLNATNARKSLNTILEAALSAPVQSGGGTIPDGFCSLGGKASCLHLHERERCSNCPVNEQIDNDARDRFEATRLSPSPAEAAEPVAAWKPLDRNATLGILWRFRKRKSTIDEAANEIEVYVANAIDSTLKMIRARYTIPPVRGDREAIAPDRETLIHTICPHIRQYSDSHWQGNHACLQCPATVKISQGDAVQRCRRDAEGAADDVIRCWQSTGDQPTPQVSGASTPSVASHDGDTR